MNSQTPVQYGAAYCRTLLGIVCIVIMISLCDTGIGYAEDVATSIDAGEPIYQSALKQARQGRFAASLKQFEKLITTYPDNRRYFYDYIAVLGWAEQDQKVLDQLSRLRISNTPIYVLETEAKSARNLGRFQTSIDLYQAALKKDKRRIPSRAGLAMALADNGRTDEALKVLDAAPSNQADNIEVLQARAYTLYIKREYFAALQVYEKILDKSPQDREAQRGRILTLARLGAPHQALRMARKTPDVLSRDEIDAIEADALAMEIRWGRLRQGPAAQRNAPTDKAIERLYDKLQTLDARGQGDSPLAHRYRFDLIVALADRHRMNEAIELHDQLVADEVEIPAYVLTSTADAHLYLEQPEQARDLYLQALQQQPGDFDTTIGLFYAYVELENHKEAQATIDGLAEQTPEWIRRDDGTPPEPNPQKVQADTTAALARGFADRPKEAYKRMHWLNEQAPHNGDIRSGLAYISLWRGWPRHALSDFELALNADPGNLEARTGHANALLYLNEFQHSESEIQQLGAEYPGNKSVVDLQRVWEVHNMRELRVSVARGLNSGFQEGTDDLTFNAYLYASPQHYRYRPFLHGFLDRAKFPQGHVTYRRYGAGLEYRRRDIEMTGELSTGAGDQDDLGLGAQLAWMPDDYWRFDFAADSYSNDIPLRARLDDIDGWSTSVNATYRFSESRRIGLGLQYIDFSDDNLRTAGTFTYMERLVTGPKYKLDGTLELSMSHNTLDGAAYFNPERDSFQGISLSNEWLTHRRYTCAFRQRLILGVGNYHQTGFGSNGTWDARYEHDWEFSDRFSLLYGIERGRNIYDGDSELRSQIDLALVWRF
jgi:biofilm PGA synthesis protein PgaA